MNIRNDCRALVFLLILAVGFASDGAAQERQLRLGVDGGLEAMGTPHGVVDVGLVLGGTAELPVSSLRVGFAARVGMYGPGRSCPLIEPSDCREPSNYGFLGGRLAGRGGSPAPYAFLETGYALFRGGTDASGFSVAAGMGKRPDQMGLEFALGVTFGNEARVLTAALRLGLR